MQALEKLGPSYVKKRRQDSYDTQTGFICYGTDRDLDEYDCDLPRFLNKSFFDHFIRKYVQVEIRGEELKILDIGCGKGIFLGELMLTHPMVKAFGVSTYDYRPHAKREWQETVSQIDYRVGDAHKLANIFDGLDFDFIVSNYALIYAGDPLSIVKKAYKLLKPGGLAFVASPGIQIDPKQKELLQTLWDSFGIGHSLENPNGYEAEILTGYNLVLQRANSPKLPLPFRYSRGFNRYQFSEEQAKRMLALAS